MKKKNHLRVLNQELFRDKEKNREKIILANMGLVHKVAHELARKYPYNGLGLKDYIEELVEEGTVALIRAVDKFNPERASFSTYAIAMVKKAMLDYIAKMHGVSGTTFRKIVIMNKGMKDGMTVEEAYRLARYKVHNTSFDAPLDKTAIKRALNFTPYALRDCEFEFDEEDSNEYWMQTIKEGLSTLRPRQREIVERHLGLNGYAPMTFEAIGRHYGITGQSVRTSYKMAIDKLRKFAKQYIGVFENEDV